MSQPDRENFTDKELVKLIQAGDETAFEVLFHRYDHRVRIFCRKKLAGAGILDPKTVAEDATQEVWQYFSQHVDLFEALDTCLFSTWLFNKARWVCSDILKKGRSQRRNSGKNPVSLESGELNERIEAPSEESNLKDLDRLNDAIKKLTGLEQRILDLTYKTDMTQEAIANDLGFGPDTLRKRLRSIYSKLSRLLDDDQGLFTA